MVYEAPVCADSVMQRPQWTTAVQSEAAMNKHTTMCQTAPTRMSSGMTCRQAVFRGRSGTTSNGRTIVKCANPPAATLAEQSHRQAEQTGMPTQSTRAGLATLVAGVQPR